jgi:hypothetical protein
MARKVLLSEMDYSQAGSQMGPGRIPACPSALEAPRWRLPQHQEASVPICEVSLPLRELAPDKISMPRW